MFPMAAECEPGLPKAAHNSFYSTLSPINLYLPSRHNRNSHRLRRRNNTPRQRLQRQPAQPQLALLNLRNLIRMLQTNHAHALTPWIIRSLQLALLLLHTRGPQKQIRCRRRADLEVKAAVWAHRYARWDGDAWCDVCSAGIEFLQKGQFLVCRRDWELNGRRWRGIPCRNPYSSHLCFPVRDRLGDWDWHFLPRRSISQSDLLLLVLSTWCLRLPC